jgi:hypothetical protein
VRILLEKLITPGGLLMIRAIVRLEGTLAAEASPMPTQPIVVTEGGQPRARPARAEARAGVRLPPIAVLALGELLPSDYYLG